MPGSITPGGAPSGSSPGCVALRVVMWIVLFSGLNLIALVSRFVMTCISRSTSTLTDGRSSSRSITIVCSRCLYWKFKLGHSPDDNIGQMGVLQVQLQFPGIGAGQVNHVGEDGTQMTGAVENDLCVFAGQRRQFFAGRLQDKLGKAVNGGQWRTQFVRDTRQKSRAHPNGGAFGRDIAKGVDASHDDVGVLVDRCAVPLDVDWVAFAVYHVELAVLL